MISPPYNFLTRHLRLRVPVLDDALAVYRSYACDPLVTRYLAWKPHENVRETEEFLRRTIEMWGKRVGFAWAIALKNSGRPIGMIGAHPDGTQVSIGYVLARPYWNRGYMTEAVSVVSDWLMAQPGVFRVWAVCDTENSGSSRVLAKAGFQCEGTLRRWIVLPNRSDVPRDCMCYSRVK